jgi:hypothetical protein
MSHTQRCITVQFYQISMRSMHSMIYTDLHRATQIHTIAHIIKYELHI